MDELKTNGEVDLISRSEAMDAIRSMTISLGGKEIFHPEAKKSVLNALDDLPSVDADPVRHGRWERLGPNYYRCSVCKETTSIFSGARNYCPNCGAKMEDRHEPD